MSAIIGILDWRSRTGGARDLRRMAAATPTPTVRTPVASLFVGDGPAALGSVPAADVSGEGGDEQPFRSDGIVMVADARLDNRPELLSRLGIAQPEGRRLSDAALIFTAFRAWREDTPARLLGDFAFAVWDERRQTLFCARDHRGKRPLFYWRSAHSLAIASSPRALLALAYVPRRLNESALADFMIFMGSPDTTLFDGILRVPPAHTLTASADGVRLREYWRMEPASTPRFESDEECLEAFRALFTEAVHCRLDGAGPTAAFLSGGLDSSSVACVAARLLQESGRRLTTFTAVPRPDFTPPDVPGYYHDETPYVEAIRARYPNLDVTYVPAGGQSFLEQLDETFEMTGFPMVNSFNRPWIESIVRQAADQGFWTVLNGTEGNIWTSYSGGGGQSAAARLSRALRSRKLRPVAHTLLSVLVNNVIAPLLPARVWRGYRRKRSGDTPWTTLSPIRAEFAAKMRVGERYFTWALGPLTCPNRDRTRRRIALATETLFSYENDFQNAVRLNFGVDLRDPTSDKRLIEFCLALPNHHYTDGIQHRLLARRGMEGILPPEVVWNQQRGLQAAGWYDSMCAARGDIAREITQLERCETVTRCVDLPRMRRTMESWPERMDVVSQSLSHELTVLARGVTFGRFIRWMQNG